MTAPLAVLMAAVTLFTAFAPFAGRTRKADAASSAIASPYGISEAKPFVIGDSLIKAGSKWAGIAGTMVQPASFSDVTAVPSPKALKLAASDSNVMKSVGTAGMFRDLSGSSIVNPALERSPNSIVEEGGYIKKSVLQNAAAQQGRTVDNGTVIYDEATKSAFKVVAPTSYTGAYGIDPSVSAMVNPLRDTYALTKPRLEEVFEDFSLGASSPDGEEVMMNRRNIDSFAPGVEACAVNRNPVASMSLSNNAVTGRLPSTSPLAFNHVTDVLAGFEFVDVPLISTDGISLIVSGGLAIGNIKVTARYTCSSGYEFSFAFEQESYIDVKLDINIREELRILLFGIDIPFGIGSVRGGLYLIVNLDASISLKIIEAREHTKTKLGVKGSTFLYVPTGFQPIFENSVDTEGGFELNGQINGSIKIGPMAEITILGINLAGAGAFLGIGITVNADISTETGSRILDVHLYGILNVYISGLGKRVNLIDFKPTILRKKQADTGGYQLKYEECYIKPGRACATIRERVQVSPGVFDWLPVQGIDYKVRVKPVTGADRFFPSSGWAKTNARGELYQGDGVYGPSGGNGITGLSKDDKVYFVFKGKNGTEYTSESMSPTLPFKNITITGADYFNDYVTGQVDPLFLRDWTSNDPEAVTISYFDNKNVNISQILDWFVPTTSAKPGSCGPINASPPAQAVTDAKGCFDTRKHSNPGFDVSGSVAVQGRVSVKSVFNVSFTLGGQTNECRYRYDPTMAPLVFNREFYPVENSFKKSPPQADGTIVDSMQYDEYIWILNPNGKRAVKDGEFYIDTWAYSVADMEYYIPNPINVSLGLEAAPEKHYSVTKPDNWRLMYSVTENGTGKSLFYRCVTVEWVWQAHPDPVTITSADSAALPAGGGTFRVTADGLYPEYGIVPGTGAPAGVSINKDTGLLAVSPSLSPGTYTFKISAVQNIRAEIYAAQTQLYDFSNTAAMYGALLQNPTTGQLRELYGHDPAPACEQYFTLIIGGEPEPAPAPGTPPSIGDRDDGYALTAFEGTTARYSVTASGSEPINWFLSYGQIKDPPKFITIDRDTGVLLVGDTASRGTYAFTIIAYNDYGTDERQCTVTVSPGGSLPTVVAQQASAQNIALASRGLLDRAALHLEEIQTTKLIAAAGDFMLKNPAAAFDPRTNSLAGLNATTVRWDHEFYSESKNRQLLYVQGDPDPRGISIGNFVTGDVYTNDRNFVNGAAYVNWGAQYEVRLYNEPSSNAIREVYLYMIGQLSSSTPWLRDLYKDYFSIGAAAFESLPVFEAYHAVALPNMERYFENKKAYEADNPDAGDPYGDPDNASTFEEALKRMIEEKINTLYVSKNNFGVGGGDTGWDWISSSLFDSANDFGADPLISPWGDGDLFGVIGNAGFDYGSLLDKMAGQKGGLFEVALGGSAGTVAVSEYFSEGLKNNKNASLSFIQDGATVSFAGKDLNSGFDGPAMLDFGFFAGSLKENDMLAAMGTAAGGESFIYSFAHHGDLPGMATFDVKTDFAAGTAVNVYKFDSAADSFTLISGNAKVDSGGVVKYRNNTMSDYLITTETIAGASVSAVARTENGASGEKAGYFFEQMLSGGGQIYVAAAVVALLAAALALVALRGRKKRA